VSKGLLIVISAPSGTGKTTLSNELLKRVDGIRYSVSITTRPPRPGEEDGREYVFVSEKDFTARRERGELIEWARVHGYWYGTPKEFLGRELAAGYDVLLDIDVQGGRQIKLTHPDAVLIFIAPPSLTVLEKRLRERRQDDEPSIQKRMQAVRDEIAAAADYDYLIVNHRVPEASEQLCAVVTAERCRMSRSRLPLEQAIS